MAHFWPSFVTAFSAASRACSTECGPAQFSPPTRPLRISRVSLPPGLPSSDPHQARLSPILPRHRMKLPGMQSPSVVQQPPISNPAVREAEPWCFRSCWALGSQLSAASTSCTGPHHHRRQSWPQPRLPCLRRTRRSRRRHRRRCPSQHLPSRQRESSRPRSHLHRSPPCRTAPPIQMTETRHWIPATSARSRLCCSRSA